MEVPHNQAEQHATLTKWQSWRLASRPRTLPAAVAPVIVGTALAVYAGAFRPLAALAALLAALLIQIGSNFANDLGDFQRGADIRERVGPLRVTSAGLLSPREVKTGMFAVFGLAALCGIYLITLGGWPILAIGLLSILAAVAYTAGPLPFGYYGLGDLAVFIFFGLIAVVGTFYVQAGHVTPLVWLAALPMGALVTNILVVNNIRDVDTDAQVGKRTLAVLLGRRGARLEYVALLVLSYAIPLVLLARLLTGGVGAAAAVDPAAGVAAGACSVHCGRPGAEQDARRHGAARRLVCTGFRRRAGVADGITD
jgi:1,4-dihydroxy-2-naphthoate polyprenyltransferase